MATQNTSQYRRWLNWLDNHSTTTKLCKENNGEIDEDDCIKIEWPRVCSHDLGYEAKDSTHPPQPIFGRFGGQCVLRPQDALDFSAINDAMRIAPPPRMSSWEVKSRVMLRGAIDITASIVPMPKGIGASPLVLMSLSTDAGGEPKFGLHLDAVRVLIRMMIRNPSLKLNNLPDLPHPDDLSPGVLDALSSDGTDPATINTAAKIIAARDTSNPFYRLLADGPTPEVRVKILDRCPALGPNQRKEKEKEHGNNWLWEKEKSSPEWNPVNSMGWDCAFVGALYNKMRVRKDLVDELLDMFLRYADPLDRALGKATEALQVAEAAAAFQQQSLNEAERGLDSALDFVNNGHAQLHQIAVDAVSSITGEIAQLATRERQLRDDIRSLRDRAISLPDKIDEEVGKSDACKLSPSCRAHTEFRKVTNPVKQDLIENLTSLQNQLDDLRTNVKSAAQDRLVLATQRITNLDAKLQQTRVDLERGALHAAFDLARAGLQVKMKTLFETRKALAEARRANALVMSRLAVWRDDPAALEAMSETPEIPSSSNQAQDGDGAAAQLPLNENAQNQVYFSIVGSFRTERSAFRHLLDLNRIEKGLDLDVFLPFSKSRYWVVTSASFSTLEEAKKRAKYARQTNLQNDAFVLGMPNAIQ